MQIKIDTREKAPEYLISKLEKLGYEIEEKLLESGDIYCPEAGLLIERKSSSDFCSSFTSGRLYEQLENLLLQDVETKVLLIENKILRDWASKGGVLKINTEYKKPIFIKPNSYNNFLLSFEKKGLMVLYTDNVIDTAHSIDGYIKYLTKDKIHSEHILKPKATTLREEQLRAVCSFGGIGVKQAITLMEEFGTVKNVFDSVNSWSKLDGFGEKTEEAAIKLLNSPFEEIKKKVK